MNREDYKDLSNPYQLGIDAVKSLNNSTHKPKIIICKCKRLDSHANYPAIYAETISGRSELFVSKKVDAVFMEFFEGAKAASQLTK